MELEPANVSLRVAALFLDLVLFIPVAFILYEIFGKTRFDRGTLEIVDLALYVVYGWICLFRFGRTLGMRLARIRLRAVTESDPITVGRLGARSLVAMLPLLGANVGVAAAQYKSRSWVAHHGLFGIIELLSLLCWLFYLRAVWNDRKQTLQDEIARTIVISDVPRLVPGPILNRPQV